MSYPGYNGGGTPQLDYAAQDYTQTIHQNITKIGGRLSVQGMEMSLTSINPYYPLPSLGNRTINEFHACADGDIAFILKNRNKVAFFSSSGTEKDNAQEALCVLNGFGNKAVGRKSLDLYIQAVGVIEAGNDANKTDRFNIIKHGHKTLFNNGKDHIVAGCIIVWDFPELDENKDSSGRQRLVFRVFDPLKDTFRIPEIRENLLENTKSGQIVKKRDYSSNDEYLDNITKLRDSLISLIVFGSVKISTLIAESIDENTDTIELIKRIRGDPNYMTAMTNFLFPHRTQDMFGKTTMPKETSRAFVAYQQIMEDLLASMTRCIQEKQNKVVGQATSSAAPKRQFNCNIRM